MLSLCVPFSALAQDAPAADDGGGARLEEIVVTAQKREQRLQDVPVAITAVSAETITANRITSVRDLSALAPGLLVRSQPGGGSLPSYTMRGYVNQGAAVGSDRGVALYVDGVYIGAGNGSLAEMADIQRIEVLRGPQGTLFGRNSTAGAISIITAEPAADFGVKVDASVGNYDYKRISARVNTGEIGAFSASLKLTHSEKRGDVKNLGAGTIWDFTPAYGGALNLKVSPSYLGGYDTDSVAAAIKFEPTADLKMVYRFDHVESVFTQDAFGSVYRTPLIRGLLVGQPNAANFTPLSDERPKAVNNWNAVPTDVKNWGHSLTVDYRISDAISVKNVFAYRRSTFHSYWNNIEGMGGLVNLGGPTYAALLGPAVAATTIGSPLLIQATAANGTADQWSDEFQVNYNSELLTLTAGGIYFQQFTKAFPTGEQRGLGLARSGAFRVYPGFLVPFAGQPIGTEGRLTKVKSKSTAVYAQGELHLGQQLDVIAGVRYTEDKKAGLDATVMSAVNRVPILTDYSGDKITYNLGVNYKLTSDKLIYAKYSTGYISGGALGLISYDPEIAKAWEGGLKADWLDGTLRTNLALFHVKYTNIQNGIQGSLLGRPEITNLIANVGDAKAQGAELETTFSPIRNLVFTANAGYLDFKYTRLTPLFTTGTAESFPIGRSKWTANLSAQYTTNPLWDDVELTARIDGAYRSSSWGITSIQPVNNASGFTAAEQATFRAAGKVPAHWLWNARVALQNIQLGEAKGTLALWGRNIFNDKSPATMLSLVTVIGTTYEQARTVGLDLTVEF